MKWVFVVFVVSIFTHLGFAQEDASGFESYQDPNLLKTAPRRLNRIPANQDGSKASQFNDNTEGQYCYGNCEETEEETKTSFFDIF